MTENAFQDHGFDYVKFVDEGFVAQSKYAKAAGDKWTPLELMRADTMAVIAGEDVAFSEEARKARFAKVIEHFGHMMEEMIEARVYVPRRSWKNNEPSFLDNGELRQEFIAECYDILLFHRAILAYAGISGAEFAEVALQKSMYNQTRPDHNVNGNAAAASDPAAELKGDCVSAAFNAPATGDSFGFNT